MGGFVINTPSLSLVEEWGCRQRSPSILWLGGSCWSLVVVTTSLMSPSERGKFALLGLRGGGGGT